MMNELQRVLKLKIAAPNDTAQRITSAFSVIEAKHCAIVVAELKFGKVAVGQCG